MKRRAKSRSARNPPAQGIDSQSRTDLSRQTIAEPRLLQAAWKEALADLTPSLTHDFNNMLTGILATSEAYLERIGPEHAFHEGLTLIKQQAFEASQLVHRIARLYQEKTGRRSYHDLNSVVAGVAEVLSKLTPRRIGVSTRLSVDSLPVYVDEVDLRRVILSLGLRAVDSIFDQGKLHFQTSRHETMCKLDTVAGKFPRLPAVRLSIAGSAVGKAAQQDPPQRSAFAFGESPEETTLSLFYARHFMENSGGAISFESNQGPTTALSIWLPQADFTEGER